MLKIRKNTIAKGLALLAATICFVAGSITVHADGNEGTVYFSQPTGRTHTGGGYAATGQIPGTVYSTKVYDATNGLPTSDANYVLGSSDGYVWVGGYGGVFKYDGSSFEKLDSSGGLTNARGIFEDSKGRIWVGTNDNGVVVINKDEQTHISYEDGLMASSIRVFAEDSKGNVYIGTTAGVYYVDEGMRVNYLSDVRINDERILRLDADVNGKIYGATKNGRVFSIVDRKISEEYTGADLGIENITTILADRKNVGKVYLCTDSGTVYYGTFGMKRNDLNKISVKPLERIQWACYACDRVWIASTDAVGYLDLKNHFHQIENIAINSSIEMMGDDYQGNMWFASSTQGVMKLVPNNFENLTQSTDLEDEVVNATQPNGELLYVGTNNGLRIVNQYGKKVENELTEYIGGSRIRCIARDSQGSLWFATFNKEIGLVCYKRDGQILSYTKEKGMPSSEIRCIKTMQDGRILVGTNDGVAILQNGKIVKTAGVSDGIHNTVILTIEEGEDGEIMAGSDGDGIYLLSDAGVKHIGREEGLSSDVILQIKKDEKRNLYWIVTSNSIEYLKDGVIRKVSTFPYDNNYDVIFDENNGLWVLSSCGVFNCMVEDLLEDNVENYSLYSVNNGLPFTPTANAFSKMDSEGNVYMAGRNGVVKVNINTFTKTEYYTNIVVRSVTYNGEEIKPVDDVYTIPSGNGRIRIKPALLDYTMSDPIVKVFFEGEENKGVLGRRSVLPDLEYTDLKYGKYTMHIQIMADDEKTVLQDMTFKVEKKPRFFEMTAVQFLIVGLLLVAISIIIWRVLSGTVVQKQYRLIREAKEDAERANTAKSRFLANVSNELLTPVSTIMGMDEMILRENADDVPKPYYMSIVNYALDIKNASDKLNSMVRDLIEISNIEAGKMHLQEQEYNVPEMLNKVLPGIEMSCEEKGLGFETEISEDLPVRLYGDSEKIRQILMNLLSNAVKYTEKGKVFFGIKGEEKDDQSILLHFTVKDTGSGMTGEEKEQILHGEQNNLGAVKGTGLGLDISRRFAKVMNGSIDCESIVGEGSEFVFTVSQGIVQNSEAGENAFIMQNQIRGPYVPEFIAPDAELLVMDYNIKNLTIVKGLLRQTRVFVTTATDKEDGFDKIKHGDYALVLAEPRMPGIDAPEMIKKIRTLRPEMPVYAFTADTSEGENYYIELGYNGIVEKPIDSMLLEKTIEKHLPEQIMMKPISAEGVSDSDTELPEGYSWIAEIPDISISDGVHACGGMKVFISSLKLFYDTIEHNAEEIETAYAEGNTALYTVKIRILKTSARFVGAGSLAVLAEGLEAAGKRNDADYMEKHTEELMKEYRFFREKLKEFENAGQEGKE